MAEQSTGTPFSDLVRDQRARLRLSLRALAEKCVDPETGATPITKGWIERVEKRMPVITPQKVELRAMAAGLQLPLQLLQDEASVQFLGRARPAEWSADSSVRAVVAEMETLSEADREELRELAEMFARRRRAQREQGES